MEVDFSATSQGSRSLSILEVGARASPTHYGLQSKLPILRLTSENAKLAWEVLEAFGTALGPKHGAYAIDSILSDLLDSWEQEDPTISQFKEWAGSIVVATKVN